MKQLAYVLGASFAATLLMALLGLWVLAHAEVLLRVAVVGSVLYIAFSAIDTLRWR